MEIVLIKQKTQDCNIYSVAQYGKPILWSNLFLTPHPDFFLTDLGINKGWMPTDWLEKYNKITQEIVFNMNRKTQTLHEIKNTDYLPIKQFPNSVIQMYDYNGDRVPPPAIDARDVDAIYINLWLSSIIVKNKLITVCLKINKITMFQSPSLIKSKELDYNVTGRFSIEIYGFYGEFESFIRDYLNIPMEKKIKIDNTKHYMLNPKEDGYYIKTDKRLINGLATLCIDSSDVISIREMFWSNNDKIVLPQMFNKNKLVPKKEWFNVAYEI